MGMILTEKQIANLSQKAREQLLKTLYNVEDELLYKCKKVSNTIDYLQKHTNDFVLSRRVM